MNFTPQVKEQVRMVSEGDGEELAVLDTDYCDGGAGCYRDRCIVWCTFC